MQIWNKWGNGTLIETIEEELPDSTFYWLLISIVAAIVWIIYLTYYNSRILGILLTLIINKVVKWGHIRFGSFSFSVLSGKVMFRDVHIITEDFSLRVQLGLAIFRWWRPLIQKEINEDLSHCETRLSVYLDTFELHVYNRSGTYAQLEKLFGLDLLISPPNEENKSEETKETTSRTAAQNMKRKWTWRSLVPVIKLEISSGKMVFGNYLLPTTLSLNFGDAHIVYTTKPASTPFDQFMHIIKCKADNIRVILVPSPKYKGPVDEPPRFMGEGFVVLQSNDTDIYYYHDEPGLVPYEPELVQLANGDVIARRTWPCWGMDIKFGKTTDISYGPWADRQREFLWKFFYPADYQPIDPTDLPEPGQMRIFKSFDFKMSMQHDATLDILFTKNKETQAVHMNTKAGSYLEFTIPMVIEEEGGGYTTKINGQLMHLDATTSLQFRQLAECETFAFDIEAHYPRVWNEPQDWKCEITACKASVFLIFHHKVFFSDMIEDWSTKARPDIFHFVPYTWHFSFLMKEFELTTLANEYNWIDCFGQTPENAQLAFAGDTFDMSFNLPFIDYLPPVVPMKFFIRGESVDCRLCLPETNTSRHVIAALAENSRLMDRDGTVNDMPFNAHAEKKWRRQTQKSNGWIDCWTTPIVAISIGYMYHPIPPTGDDHHRPLEEPISTPDAEEQLLIPLRLVPLRPLRPKKNKIYSGPDEFDPTQLEADVISVELEVGPSTLCLYGSLLRNLLHVKENYFGEDEKFTDYQEVFSATDKASNFTLIADSLNKAFDPRQYRPLHVKVQVTLHDIHAHLLKNCSENGPPCPSIYLERLGFEMDKTYTETQLQVLVSPAILVAKDDVERPGSHQHLREGHLALSGLQVRGHAMFSHEGLPLDSETLEYAWMVEATIGDVTGRLTAPQLQSIIEALQTFVFLVEDSENDLQRASPYKTCQHGLPQPECSIEPKHAFPCPTSDDIKYRMTRVSMDCVDLYLVETGAALNIQLYPLRASTCNLHGKNNKAGVTALIPHFNIKQYILSQDYSSHNQGELWLEAGGISLGPLNVDAAMALPSEEFHNLQDQFVKLHDKRTHRLWFLWPPDLSVMSPKVVGKCGCVGGCRFFGKNRNGPRFFQPEDKDFFDSINAAVLHMCTDGELGYGQSILHKGQLVFDIPGSAMPTTPSKARMQQTHGFMGSKLSVDTPRTSTTLVDDSQRQAALLGFISDHSSIELSSALRGSEISGSDRTLKESLTRINRKSFDPNDRESGSTGRQSFGGGSIPSEYLPESPMPDAYDTDKYASTPSDTGMTWMSGASGSVTSLPEAVQKPKKKSHERTLSYDPHVRGHARKPSENTISSDSFVGSPTSVGRRDSKGSLPSSGGYSDFKSMSRHSSLTSPVLRRLSSQLSFAADGSVASMTGSENFFSAAEEVGSDPSLPDGLRRQYARQASSASDRASLLSSSYTDAPSPMKSFSSDCSGSQTILQQTVIHRRQSSASDSESIASFVSAVSSQHASTQDVTTDLIRDSVKISPPSYQEAMESRERDPLDMSQTTNTTDEMEDAEATFTETPSVSNDVDLHGQLNQQITKSPLLMSCYINHLTQLTCSHWAAPPPLPHLVAKPNPVPQDTSTSIHSRMSTSAISDHPPTPAWIPQFAYRRDGFGPSVMVNKKEMKTPPSISSPSSASDWDKPKYKPFDEEADLGFTYEDHVSKTTAVVNLKGSVDILISPLMLESLQRFVEAVTPVLGSLHPSAIVDTLHCQCSNMVKAHNKLKKTDSKTQCPEREKDSSLTRKGDTSPGSSGDAETTTSKTSRLQLMVSLSRINICIMQVSLVEEVIAFSALDHIRDLTCVSILACCLDSITCQLLTNNHSHKSIEAPSDSSPDSVTKKPIVPENPRNGKKKVDVTVVDDADHMVEMQREEMVGNLHIGRIHFQLRRMKKNSNFSEKVFLTAIPEYRSRTLFTFQKSLQPVLPDRQSTPMPMGSMDQSKGIEATIFEEETTAEDIAGFIMFECGLEDISLKAAKRSGFHGNLTMEDEENMQHIDSMLQNIQERTTFSKENRRKQHNLKPSNGVGDTDNRDSDSASGGEGSNASGLGNSADDEASSWHSRVSIASDEIGEETEETEGGVQELQGDASSCSLEFKTVWFNFAAPPPSPRKRKLEYTRLDWNLLSTATPAINAWMNPGHRAMVAVRILVSAFKHRVNTVMACIMTEALDVQSIHVPPKSKYNKITSLSRTLQEDPSCQLLTVLRRYISRVGITVINENINVDTIPQLITIQKGLLALTRQWKNILYMPVLADQSFKSKKKPQFTVTFAIPKEDSVDNFPIGMEDELTLDNFEVVDEKTSLLKAEESIHRTGSFESLPGSLQGEQIPLERPASAMQLNQTPDVKDNLLSKETSSESRHSDTKRASGGVIKTQSQTRLRTSIPTTPFGSIDSPAKFTNTSQHSQSCALGAAPSGSAILNPPKMQRNESNISFSSQSVSSMEHNPTSGPGTPLKQSLTRQLSELEKREDEDLYRWMQRQQEYTRLCNQPSLHYYPSVGHESFINTGLSEYSQDDSISMQRLAVAHSLQLADAQVLFKPLLKSIGIHLGAVKSSAFMKKFGGNVSISGMLQTLRVDIVDSETGTSRKTKHKASKGRPKKLPKLHIDVGIEMPAFLCNMFTVMIGMKDIVDFEKEKHETEGSQEWRRRSLKAIKFAMDHMEAKPTTTKVHFSVNVNAVNQHVNMSLLRLVHQFMSMIENINETRVELSGRTHDGYKTHRKQDSKGSSTGTESHSGDAVETGKADIGSPLGDIELTPDSGGNPSHQPPPRPPPPRCIPTPKPLSPQPPPLASPQSEVSDSSRPDRLPLFHYGGKSPKKFSLRGKKATEFFGSKSSDTNTGETKSATHIQSPPLSLNLSDSVAVEMADTSSPALAEKTIVDEIKENTPKCWRTLYHLLDLYSTMPETKTLGRRPSASRLSVIDEEPEKVSQTHSLQRHDSSQKLHRATFIRNRTSTLDSVERQPMMLPSGGVPHRSYTGHTFTQITAQNGDSDSGDEHFEYGNESIFIQEQIPLVVFGIAKVRRIHISAMLSGLKLEADLQNVHASATHRERVKGVIKRKSRESSATAYVGHTMIVLLEGVPPSMQTVVTVNIAKSQGLYSSVMKRSKEHNSALVTIGKIDVDIPQHPVVLHGMVARSSRRLSSTLQEFMRPPTKYKSYDSVDSGLPSQQPSKHSELSELMNMPSGHAKQQKTDPKTPITKALVVHFKATLQGLTIGASLLPSLKAQYKMGEVTSSGVTGIKARFNINLPTHSLSFSSKVSNPYARPPRTPVPHPRFPNVMMRNARLFQSPVPESETVSTPSTLPSSASVDLPPIHIHADYRLYNADTLSTDGGLTEGLVLREGNYLNAVAEVGTFEHSLTTDLLNHLVFVQKVFMKEVNEVVQKVSGADQPVPLWEEGFAVTKETTKPMLYSLHFRFKGIIITATTPTSNAVRLETGSIDLELSNRVQTASKDGTANKNMAPKVFVKAQVNLNLALGTILRNLVFEEAEAEFQSLAWFKTKIGLRNALQDEMIPGVSKDQEALLITLNRPIIFVQPAAFDRAVLVWLNYKNAYEYWNEQRLALNKEVQTATQQVMDKLPLSSISQQSAPALGTLFLQLTVDDLGICLPMSALGTQQGNKIVEEAGAAVVLTLESTRISACSCQSLVSKGRFNDFCLRIADDFEVSWDDWKPDKSLEVVMNAMVVPEGTYEVCSRTQANEANSNAKWVLNVTWQMKGLDVHLNTNVGKRLSALGNTLTSLTGDVPEQDEEEMDDLEDTEETESELPTVKIDPPSKKMSALPEGLPDLVYDTSLDPKARARLIEKEMNEQAKVVEVLKQLGANPNTIEAEERKLQELESAVFQDFRQDIMKKLKRQSVKATAIKDKLGLGYKPAHIRSKSTGTAPHAITGAPRRKEARQEGRRFVSCRDELIHENEFMSPGGATGHTRALSIDVSHIDVPKVTFDNSPHSMNTDLLSTTIDNPLDFGLGDDVPLAPQPSPSASFPAHKVLQDILDTTSSDSAEDADPEMSYLRKASRRLRGSPSSQTQRVSSPIPKRESAGSSVIDPSVDFELDVKVRIDSGQCVLHPKVAEDLETRARSRSISKRDSRDLSPKPTRKQKKHSTDSASSRTFVGHRNLGTQQSSQTDKTTVFFLPGVDVKVRYNSKTSADTESPPGTLKTTADPSMMMHAPSTPDPFDASSASTTFKREKTTKKANLYAWLSLQQLSEEMLISPVLLDFLEQALEPIPMIGITDNKLENKPSTSSDNGELDASYTSLVSASNYSYASFPVDVVVYIRVQPSFIRFTCLPVSRVECLLRLPSLDLVFSTKRGDVEDNMLQDTNSPPTKVKSEKKGKKGLGSTTMSAPSLSGMHRTSSSSRMRNMSGHITLPESSPGGGLSVTGCLADFSLYVFHPYGHGQKKTPSLTALENSFRKNKHGANMDSHHTSSPLADSGRKDSLSLQVEFVKVNISRGRRGILHSDAGYRISDQLDAKAANIVRFSAICDIGSASFKYDMRRLAEILALPKAWYRRALARRMFLGEESATNIPEETDEDDIDMSLSSTPPTPDSPLFSPFSGRAQTISSIHTSHLTEGKPSTHRRVASEDRNVPINLEFKKELEDLNQSRTPSGSGSTPQSPSDEKTVTRTPSPSKLRLPSGGSNRQSLGQAHQARLHPYDHLARPASQFNTTVVPGKGSIRDWETLVLFAVNLARLDVNINMSNVMGNVNWATTDLKSQGRLNIDSTGYRNMKISSGLGNSKLEARGGIVGGNIELHQLHSNVSVNEDPGHEPDHQAGLQLHTLEARLDYMGSSVLMGRVSFFNMTLSDEWRLDIRQLENAAPTTSRVMVFVHGDLAWDKFHLLLSRSTTPDIIKMVTKLEEFFTQQLNSSKRMLSHFGTLHARKTPVQPRKSSADEASWISEIRHHRHWQKVLGHVSGCKLPMFSFKLPKQDTILGGTISLHGNNLSLACFHGINFRSKSWALFTMDEPIICFATEAVDIIDEDGVDWTHVVQDLSFQLGHNLTEKRRDKHMATILKLSRGHYMPPPFTNVQDWFHYAFASTEIKDLDNFPQVVPEGGEQSPTERRASSRKTQEYNHETEIVFALPTLEMHLKTEHKQGEQEPSEEDEKPVVECSLVTQFEDHIFVAMDAEVILFVHDLVTSYVKEKDRGTRSSTYGSRMPQSPDLERKNLTDPTTVLKQDFRHFECKTWLLEPTVRLISWAGKRIDPVGVDYILQKLGFQHARLTIPKWMQRGAMDPLDKILSLLTDNLITVLREMDDGKEGDKKQDRAGKKT